MIRGGGCDRSKRGQSHKSVRIHGERKGFFYSVRRIRNGRETTHRDIKPDQLTLTKTTEYKPGH